MGVCTFSFLKSKITDGKRGLEEKKKRRVKTLRKRGLDEWEIRGISPRGPINLEPGVNHAEGCQPAVGPRSFL